MPIKKGRKEGEESKEVGPLGEIYFGHFLVLFVHWTNPYYFYRKRQIYTISRSPELSIFFDLQTPVRPTRCAQLSCTGPSCI